MNENIETNEIKVEKPKEEKTTEKRKARPVSNGRLNVHQRINKIMGEVILLKKDKVNKFQNYEYISHEAITNSIRDAMVKFGVNHISEFDNIDMKTIESKRGVNFLISSNIKHSFVNIDEPSDRVVFTHFAMASDTGDKGVWKLITNSKKYAFSTMFVLADGVEGKGDKIESSDSENENCISEPTKLVKQKIKEKPKATVVKSKATCKICNENLIAGKDNYYCPNFKDEDLGKHTIVPMTHIRLYEEYQSLLIQVEKVDPESYDSIVKEKKPLPAKINQLKNIISFLM